ETSVIVVGAAVLSCLLAWWMQRARRALVPATGRDALVAVAAGLGIAFLFYSSFFAHPWGPIESFLAFGTYIGRGVDPAGPAHPIPNYFQLLAWSSSGGLLWTEGVVLLLAVVGLAFATRRATTRFWPVYLALYAVITALVFSALKYKTPWNLLPFYAGWILMAGIGVSVLWEAARPRWARALLIAALAAASWHLGVQSVRANLRYPADPRNPYVYAHTTPDFLRLAARVRDLSAVHEAGQAMLVQVVAGPYEQWPLPWYLRDMTRVGYWTDAASAALVQDAPVIIASQDHAAAVEAAAGERYVSEFYGLRPEVLLTVFIERSLWERFLATR
ncbi:MAG TPA: hypothetical protein VK911_06805, partial [Vicinamibacterales bacterium]|nr:hypothetical protein [Vicinamibacterales bacterium]